MGTRTSAASAALLACLAIAVLAQGSPANALSQRLTYVTDLEGISEYRMDNGLCLLLCPDSSATTITVNMIYRTGSKFEGPGESGMAHLLEHLLGNGTADIPDLNEALSARGADYNGSTWYDRVQFHETLASDGGENLDFALHLEAERMHAAVLSEESLALEMKIITNEFQYIENDLDAVLWYRMMSVAYDWHGYGRSPVGTLSDIQSYPIENLQRFYRRHFRPDNATLVVAGRFDVDQALSLAVQHFGDVPRPDTRLPTLLTEEPPQEGPRQVVLQRDVANSSGGLLYHTPAGLHRDTAALAVILEIMTDPGLGLLVEPFATDGRVSGIRGEPESLQMADPGVLDIRVGKMETEDPVALMSEIADACESIADRITDEDVACAKARLMKRQRRTFADVRKLAIQIGEWVAQGDWRGVLVNRDRIADVSTARLKMVARKYLCASNRSLGVVIATRDPQHVKNAAGIASRETLMDDYRGEAIVAEGEFVDDSLDSVRKMVQKFEIEPGPSVSLAPKHTRGATVTARLRFNYGTPESMRDRNEAGRLLPDLLMRGTRNRDYRSLRRTLDLLQSDLTISGFPGTINIQIDSDRTHIVGVIALLADVLRNPRLDSDAFAITKQEHLAKLEAQLNDPMERCFNAVRRGLYTFPTDSPYYKPTLEERIAELRSTSVADVRNLHRELLGATYSQAAFVGDFASGEVLVALGRAFKGWDSPQVFEPNDPPYRPIAEARSRIIIPDKPMAVAGCATLFRLRDDEPDYPALLLAKQVLAGGPTSRIPSRLRYREGLSYHASAAMQVESRITSANLFGYAFCAPTNADTCIAGLREEIHRWVREGITESELEKAKNTWRKEFELRLGDDAELASELLSLQYNDRCLDYYDGVLSAMQSLVASDINVVLRRRLADAHYVSVQAGDLEIRPPD